MSSSLDMKGGVCKLKESVDKDDVETDFSRKGEAKITYTCTCSCTYTCTHHHGNRRTSKGMFN